MGAVFAHDDDADGGALVDRLHDVRRRQDVTGRGFAAVDRHALRDGDAGRLEDDLGLVLLHGERRGEDAGMGVGQAQDLEQALDRAVLAEAAVQRVEDDIGLRREVLEHGRDVRPDVDRRDPIALPLERLAAGLAGAERDLPLGRPPAHQHRDVFWCGHEAPWSLGAWSSDAGEQVAHQDPRSSAPGASGGRFERVNLTHTVAPSRSRATSSPSLMSRAAAVSSGIRKARSSSHLSSLKRVVNGIGATPGEPYA